MAIMGIIVSVLSVEWMTYWQLGIRNGSMCNESDVSERAVANPETIQNGVRGNQPTENER
jgi:hypothetical protein